jgi:serine phosphatase RsbU (regulator of sigma subunit)
MNDMVTQMRFYALCFFLWLFGFVARPIETAGQTTASAQPIPLFTYATLSTSSTSIGEKPWRYRAGDDSTQHALWSARDFNDSAWRVVPRTMRLVKDSAERDWKGIGWYRFRFRIDSAAYAHILCISINHRGGSEIYIDGKRAGGFGVVSAERDKEREFRPFGDRSFVRFRLDPTPDGLHTIAIRYSETRSLERSERFFPARSGFGFYCELAAEKHWNVMYRADQRWMTLMAIAVGGMAALCLLHLNLLVFVGGREHLLYCCFTGGIAWFFGARLAEKWLEENIEAQLWLASLNQYVMIFAFIACVGFFYAIFATKRPIGIWLVALLPAILFWGGSFVPYLQEGNRTFLVFVGVIFGDIMRIIIRGIFRRQKGAWILGAGGVLFIVSLGAQLLAENHLIMLPYEDVGGFLVMGSFFSIPLAMSIFLSQNIAATNKELSQKLVEVERLTDKTIQQEVERKVLEADNERKTQELEEARKLQLSMLPQTMPQIQGLDIAMFMQTATEVGGDYYDYFIDAADGALTIVIGDATGHGVKAGTMVAATKSLVAAMVQDDRQGEPAAGVLKPSSPILKRMNMRSMFMALAIARVRSEKTSASNLVRVTLANAGMPSALVFRAAESRVEEVLIKAMPLGTMANFPYEDREITLSSGDALILMSDGFPERFNRDDEIFGYEAAKSACQSIGGLTAGEIIKSCVATANAWADGAPLNDDMTFVVMRVL